MSYSTVLAVMPERRPIAIKEFRNSHGWSPSIWSRLMKHNYGYTGYLFGGGRHLDRLWNDIENLPEWQQAPLVWTFDTGVIPCTAFDWAADMLDEFEKRLPAPDNHVNHVPAMVELLRSGPEAPLIGVYGTSCSENPFDPWDGENDCEGSGIPASGWYVLPQHRAGLAKMLEQVASR